MVPIFLLLALLVGGWLLVRRSRSRSSSVPPSFFVEPAQALEDQSREIVDAAAAGVTAAEEKPLADDAFDVCVMGAGAAGLMQVRHLQLERPGLKICLVDPLSSERTESDDACHKIGESTVFTSATFLVRDLDLGDYLIAHHYPKHGLFYHWPKEATKTDTLADYYSAASLTLPEVPSFQIDRPKFERDLLAMVLADPGTRVTYLQGRVKQIKFADDEKPHEVEDQAAAAPPATVHGERASVVEVLLSSGVRTTVRAAHLVDAAGRAFLVGKRKGLLVKEPSELMSIDNASVWLQVNDLDSGLLVGGSARGQTLASWLFATNHFCGDGHWLWVIPVKNREDRFSLSIGVSFHKQRHQLSAFNSRAKFLAFLKANHTLLHSVVQSGTIGLFRTLPRLAHVSRQMYDGPGRWYVLGEAAYNADPWYSTGLAWCSYQIQHITAIVRAKDAARRAQQAAPTAGADGVHPLSREADELAVAYNSHACALTRSFFLLISRHWNHLGNASIMSWRLLLETCVPAAMAVYFSKGYLCPHACRATPALVANRIWLFEGVYDLFDELVEKRANVGFQDYNEPGQVKLAGLMPGCSSSMVPLDMLSLDDNLRGGKYTFRSANIAKSDAVGNWYVACALATLVWRGFGWRGLTRPAVYERLGFLLRGAARSYKASLAHAWAHRHQEGNRRYAQREREFKNYAPGQDYVPWDASAAAADE